MANSQDIKDPEVVAWVTNADVRDFGKGQGESVFLFEHSGRWNIPLITLQSHRDAMQAHLDWLDVVKQQRDHFASEASELREVMAEVTRRFEELKRHGVPYQVHNEAIANRDAALVACVEALELGRDYANEARDEHARTFGGHPATQAELDLIDAHRKQIDAAITHANQVLGRKEGE